VKEFHISPTEFGDMTPLQHDALIMIWNRKQKEEAARQKKEDRKAASRKGR
jgi:hypothetical protein